MANALPGALYFSADDGTSGRELWRSDGTAAGTARVADIFPGQGSSEPIRLTVHGDTLYFVADDGRSGRELWRSDGTAAGTFRVADINPGVADAFDPYFFEFVYPDPFFTSYRGALYFVADDGSGGTELWRSDGTAASTARVADINPGAESSYPASRRGGGPRGDIVVYDGALYFSADDGASGRELWRSDGTPGGTLRVTDINPGPATADPGRLTV